jgi:hypothetical protein
MTESIEQEFADNAKLTISLGKYSCLHIFASFPFSDEEHRVFENSHSVVEYIADRTGNWW